MPLVSVGTCRTSRADIELFYETFGDPKDEALILIMGLGAQMLGWDERLCENLAAKGYYVVRFDNRDCGLSCHLDDLGLPYFIINYLKRWCGMQPWTPYTLSDMALDVVRLMDALEIPSAHIAGASMGGMIGQILTMEHPDRVRSLCSIMSTTGASGLPQPSFSMLLQMIKPAPSDREGRIAHSIKTIQMLTKPEDVDTVRTRAYVERCLDRTMWRAGTSRQLCAVAATPDRTAALRSIRMTIPVLVMHGVHDPLVTFAHGEATHAAVPHSELRALDMGHIMVPRNIEAIAEGLHHNAQKAQRQ
uniref:AB hydrolase-1 domain-containing protein n=1 Tax=Eutreptiella gymnastica TaxID=73025 RepID=A0A7S1JAS6_9EUGL|mmetsp:Transcript_80781/g.142312  ORF Transcript_80781/g.142312 Transcript_80781/m.142312 type:complete len:304 (+) Transcript_80781:26-937(+)